MGLGVRTYIHAYGQTDVCTDNHVTTKIFEIDGLPNFLRYGTPLASVCRSSAINCSECPSKAQTQ